MIASLGTSAIKTIACQTTMNRSTMEICLNSPTPDETKIMSKGRRIRTRVLGLFLVVVFFVVNSGCTYTKTNSVGNTAPLTAAGEETFFVARKGSLIYHKPDCKYLGATGYVLNPEEIVVFKDREEAVKAHYLGCPLCKPDLREEMIAKEEKTWLVFLLGVLGLAALIDGSVAASFGGEGFFMEVTD